MKPDEHPFLQQFPLDAHRRLVEEGERRTVPAGEYLFREGDPSEFAVVLLGGAVDLVKTGGEGRENLVLAKREAGALFGELGVLDESPRSAAARVEEEADVLILPSKLFLEVLQSAPVRIFQNIFRATSENLRQTNEKFLTSVLHKEKMAMVGEMAGRIIHDFRNPFTHIRLVGDILAQNKDDEGTVRLAKSLDRQIDKMESMATDLLEYSKGTASLEMTRISVKHLFSVLEEDNREILATKNVTLEVHPEDFLFRGDRDKLPRVLQNLINNAVDAMKDQKDAKITLSAREDQGQVIVEVTDNGPGIPEAIRSTLFEPFVTHGKPDGTGIGLAIAKSFMEAHQGEISCSSEPGKGTTFSLSFPKLNPSG